MDCDSASKREAESASFRVFDGARCVSYFAKDPKAG